MKHVNAEMIKAVADNTELVILVNVIDPDNETGNYWSVSSLATLAAASNDFFLYLPQHKDACLHWLSGGEVEILDGKGFYSFACYAVNGDWYPDHAFMNEHEEFRIKPKKEKRWIAFNHENGNVYGTFLSEDKCKMAWPNLQIFEIEVEV